MVTKRKIQVVLGLLWLLDGALQLQRQMFTATFAVKDIAPATQGQPLIISGPINFAIHVFLIHPALFNLVIAGVQLFIGFLILWRPTIRVGLSASICWALIVWYIGEGLGGLLGTHTLILMGAPGAAVIYAILSLAVIPKEQEKRQNVYERPAYWLPIAWAILWIVGAIYQILPGQNKASELASMISANAIGAPNWLSSLDIHTANLLRKSGFWAVAFLTIIQLLIGVLIFLKGRTRKITLTVGCTLSLVFWVVGQSIGSLYTGYATDPNAAPLFILLGIAILGCAQLDFKKLWLDSGHRLEEFLT